jgi:hypothetical protein
MERIRKATVLSPDEKSAFIWQQTASSQNYGTPMKPKPRTNKFICTA